MNHGQRRLIGENELTACGCNPTDLVLVALSGGADSTALLLSFHELFQEGKIRGVFAAHLNHGIRGETAERDLRFCESLCERLSIPIATETADVPKRARERGESLEQAAREVRYDFLERARICFGANVIATAHHSDDQAETILINLMRGSGTSGLCGMKPRSGFIIRPMLKLSRAEILSFLAEREEAYCEDETNAEQTATRNRVRHLLMPMLESFNPAIAKSLCKTAELLCQDDAFLNAAAQEAERELLSGEGLDRAGLAELPKAISSRIVRKRLYALDGNVSEMDIRRVSALCEAQTGTAIELPGGFSAWTDATALYFGKRPEAREYETRFNPEGETNTPWGTWKSERVTCWQPTTNRLEAYLDAQKLPKDLVVRSRRAGDRFFPLGAPGEKKLSDVLTDKKIAKEQRDLPLLASEHDIYFACGLTVSERAKVTPDTREILHIICYRGTRD